MNRHRPLSLLALTVAASAAHGATLAQYLDGAQSFTPAYQDSALTSTNIAQRGTGGGSWRQFWGTNSSGDNNPALPDVENGNYWYGWNMSTTSGSTDMDAGARGFTFGLSATGEKFSLSSVSCDFLAATDTASGTGALVIGFALYVKTDKTNGEYRLIDTLSLEPGKAPGDHYLDLGTQTFSIGGDDFSNITQADFVLTYSDNSSSNSSGGLFSNIRINGDLNSSIPESSTTTLGLLGIAGLLLKRRKRC